MNKNNKGFTLIELLAVVAILGILIALAAPAVTEQVTKSRKKTFAENGTRIVTAVKDAVLSGDYEKMSSDDVEGPDSNNVILFKKSGVEKLLEKNDLTSPFGGSYEQLHVEFHMFNKDDYEIYICMIDSNHYGFSHADGLKLSSSDVIINPDESCGRIQFYE